MSQLKHIRYEACRLADLKLLVVEDSPFILDLLVEALEAMGLEKVFVSSNISHGKEAILERNSAKSDENLDVIITGTPLISITFPNFPKSILIEHKAACGCDSISDLPKIIQDTLEAPPSKENIMNFFNTVTSPFDGCASERMADVILNLAKKNSMND